jgi:hypothetical protein
VNHWFNDLALLGINVCLMAGVEPGKYEEILDLDKQGLIAVVIAATDYQD